MNIIFAIYIVLIEILLLLIPIPYEHFTHKWEMAFWGFGIMNAILTGFALLHILINFFGTTRKDR